MQLIQSIINVLILVYSFSLLISAEKVDVRYITLFERTISGTFTPPQTGEYKFYSSCNLPCNVFLGFNNPSVGLLKIISQNNKVRNLIFDEFPNQVSHLIYLQAGVPVYLRASSIYKKDGSHVPNLSVGVLLPDDTSMFPISYNLLKNVSIQNHRIKNEDILIKNKMRKMQMISRKKKKKMQMIRRRNKRKNFKKIILSIPQSTSSKINKMIFNIISKPSEVDFTNSIKKVKNLSTEVLSSHKKDLNYPQKLNDYHLKHINNQYMIEHESNHKKPQESNHEKPQELNHKNYVSDYYNYTRFKNIKLVNLILDENQTSSSDVDKKLKENIRKYLQDVESLNNTESTESFVQRMINTYNIAKKYSREVNATYGVSSNRTKSVDKYYPRKNINTYSTPEDKHKEFSNTNDISLQALDDLLRKKLESSDIVLDISGTFEPLENATINDGVLVLEDIFKSNKKKKKKVSGLQLLTLEFQKILKSVNLTSLSKFVTPFFVKEFITSESLNPKLNENINHFCRKIIRKMKQSTNKETYNQSVAVKEKKPNVFHNYGFNINNTLEKQRDSISRNRLNQLLYVLLNTILDNQTARNTLDLNKQLNSQSVLTLQPSLNIRSNFNPSLNSVYQANDLLKKQEKNIKKITLMKKYDQIKYLPNQIETTNVALLTAIREIIEKINAIKKSLQDEKNNTTLK
ncbi:uncharacterized protein LOC105848420 isoform X2 [Hydra vulgaris]|uniref:Uncharacterized protein LOC105848420 isoform X2 n=1 Tax=Hydra vulgaris TaxID=6087 RepID=A0ABM4BDG4_HYDVU